MPRKPIDPKTTADVVIYRPDGTHLIVQSKLRRRARVKVGDMIVSGDKASAAEVKMAVARSSEALNRLSHVIVEPGVRLSKRKGVPLFSIDPNNPGRVLRKLNGRVDRGILENGAFKIVD